MATKYRKIGWLIVIVLFSACDLFEMRGFVASYESADERFQQSQVWNDEHPCKDISIADDDYTLAVMADSHVGETENLKLFFDEAIQDNVVAAVMVGDVTSGYADDYLRFNAQLPAQDVLLTFPVVGNHDLYFNGWKQFYDLFGTTTYWFSVSTPAASDLYVCLDTGSGTLGSSQLAWLKDVLQNKRTHYRHCVLFTHNNLFRIRHTTVTNPCVEELRVLSNLTVQHDVDMVITGHDHKKNLVKLGNTTHITLDALKDGCPNAGFAELHVGVDDVECEFVNL
ncbi:MAG: metallophosphoesterase [Bacteroidota bacterium]|nr:metallophosphoesterase [Bacteroidota bacterium]